MKTNKANDELVDQAWDWLCEYLFSQDYHVEREFLEGLIAGENLNKTIRTILIENMKSGIALQAQFRNEGDSEDRECFDDCITKGKAILKKLKQ